MVACTSLVVTLFSVAFAQAYLVKSQQEIDGVRSELLAAQQEQARIQRLVDATSAPELVVERADDLGMIPANQATHVSAVRPLVADNSVTSQAGAETNK